MTLQSTPPSDGRRGRPTRHRGPIMLRGGEPDPTIQGTTTDQRLLDRRGPTDWVHTDPWRGLTATTVTVAGQRGPASSRDLVSCPRPPPPAPSRPGAAGPNLLKKDSAIG